MYETENIKQSTHLCGFTDKVAGPDQGPNAHLEGVTFAVVLCDAAKLVHDQLLLNGFQYGIKCKNCVELFLINKWNKTTYAGINQKQWT